MENKHIHYQNYNVHTSDVVEHIADLTELEIYFTTLKIKESLFGKIRVGNLVI